jgi:signal transduction histidine kinase/CheY-like chemotaxis protein
MNYRGFTAEEDIEHMYQAFNEVYRTGEPNKGFTWKIIRKDGSTGFADASVSPLRSQTGEIVGFRGIGRDISDRKHFEEEQQRVEKLESVGVFAGGIAHDFNNILTAILGNISLARMEAKPDSELHELLEEAEKASLRAKDLTQQMLTFTKGGAPGRELVSISQVLRDAASLALRGSNITCNFSIYRDLWHAEINEDRISQVISNIVINAQQAMPAGGTIEIEAKNITLNARKNLGKSLPLKEGNYIRIAITDHGTGIPQELLQKIFDPYFTTKQKGSGLGLATSNSIVHNHGGHISVKSELGAGSTFYVYLPAVKKNASPKKVKKKESTPVSKNRILVMDDEDAVRKVAGRMLKRIGCEDIEFAADGAEAIRLYSEAMKEDKPFDVVILDLTIPGGMGGKKAIKELLKIDPEVKVIVSSGYSSELAIAEYKQYGFSGVVAKPYILDQLRQALHDVLG